MNRFIKNVTALLYFLFLMTDLCGVNLEPFNEQY